MFPVFSSLFLFWEKKVYQICFLDDDWIIPLRSFRRDHKYITKNKEWIESNRDTCVIPLSNTQVDFWCSKDLGHSLFMIWGGVRVILILILPFVVVWCHHHSSSDEDQAAIVPGINMWCHKLINNNKVERLPITALNKLWQC